MNDKEQWTLTLSNNYTMEDILTEIKKSKFDNNIIKGIIEGLGEEFGKMIEKITIKLL